MINTVRQQIQFRFGNQTRGSNTYYIALNMIKLAVKTIYTVIYMQLYEWK